MTAIKFCGLTRRDDVLYAAELDVAYVGAILTESPRRIEPNAARTIFTDLPSTVQRVGVFGRESVEDIVRIATQARVDVIQLHGEQTAADVARIRETWSGKLWWVARVNGDGVPPVAYETAAHVEGVVLDTRVRGQLGGTGVPLDWESLRAGVRQLRDTGTRVVLAGGLNPENVGRAVETLRPDVVDVASGVESAVGVKDHARMRAFRDALLKARDA